MITLIMLTNQLRNSGPNRVMLDIARKLNRTEVNPVIIALMQDDTIRPIAAEFENIGVEIHRFNFSKFQLETQTRSIRSRLEQYIKSKFKKPIVQAHGYHPTLLTSRMDLPHTVTIHCIASEDFIKSKGFLLGHYMVWRFKRHLRLHNYPVAISKYMMEYYKPVCDGRLRLIHNGVNFEPKQDNDENLKSKLNLPNGKIIIIPGGITARKNNIHIIKQLTKTNLDNFLCVFLGIGPQLEFLKSEVGNDSRFRFEGYKPNVAEYFSCADLYISSSLSEGLPLAALEAICMGVPSLLSDIPPHREIVDIMNLNGIESFSLQSDMLSEKVKEFINSSFNKEGISTQALRHFSSQTMVRKYEVLLNEIKNNDQ